MHANKPCQSESDTARVRLNPTFKRRQPKFHLVQVLLQHTFFPTFGYLRMSCFPTIWLRKPKKTNFLLPLLWLHLAFPIFLNNGQRGLFESSAFWPPSWTPTRKWWSPATAARCSSVFCFTPQEPDVWSPIIVPCYDWSTGTEQFLE